MPDVPVYRRADDVPAYLLTSQQLSATGQPADDLRPDGYLLVELFDSRPRDQESALRFDRRADGPRQAALWAQEVLDDPDVVLLDMTSTDVNGRVIEIALVRPGGEVLLETLVNPEGEPIATDATDKHGITEAMVTAPGMPTFADLHDELVELLTGARIVCWNADVDRVRLAAEADRLLPSYSTAADTAWVQARWDSGVFEHAAGVGNADPSGDGYRPDSEHRALAGCIAMLNWLREMALPLSVPTPVRGGWSEPEIADLKAKFDTGMTPAAIAAWTGRTEASVRWKLYKLELIPFPADLIGDRGPKIPKPSPAYSLEDLRVQHANSHKRWTPEDEEQLTSRHSEGATIAQLVTEFGRNEGGITARLRRLGLIDPDLDPPL
jgi:hypothetical protein